MGIAPNNQNSTIREQGRRGPLITGLIAVVQVSDTGESADRRIVNLRRAGHRHIVAISRYLAGASGDQDLAVGEECRRVTEAGRSHTASRGEGSRERVVKLRAGNRHIVAIRGYVAGAS